MRPRVRTPANLWQSREVHCAGAKYRLDIFSFVIYQTDTKSIWKSNGHSYMNVRTLCLGILAQHDASGYEIKKAVEEGLFAHFIDASYGSIYPALTQMLGDGHVSVQGGQPAGQAAEEGVLDYRDRQDGAAQGTARDTKTGQVQVASSCSRRCSRPILTPEHLEHVFDEQIDVPAARAGAGGGLP
jgi:hypothetical protein